ncbi:hypothetical protein JXB01_02970 [Candidatus Micrarchaeota archaeon]|nr:hypothetical protein [Candidatus Micrarchaeota archaeon]
MRKSLRILEPLVKSIFWIIVLMALIYLINLASDKTYNEKIYEVGQFLSNNLALFIIASLFFNYAEYFIESIQKLDAAVQLVESIEITFAAWIIGSLAVIVGDSEPLVMGIGQFILQYLFVIFIAIAVTLYFLRFLEETKK